MLTMAAATKFEGLGVDYVATWPNKESTTVNDDRQVSGEGQHPVASGRNGPNATLIGLALLVAAGLAFFFQNGNSTSIHFLFFQKDAKTRWAIIVAVVLGIAIDRIFTIWWRRRRRQNND